MGMASAFPFAMRCDIRPGNIQAIGHRTYSEPPRHHRHTTPWDRPSLSNSRFSCFSSVRFWDRGSNTR